MITKLHELKGTAEKTTEILKSAIFHEREDKYKELLNDQIKILQKSLNDASTPEHYKVAVVGSFKVGKSSFVNALCDNVNLASVDTNPETAAITIFRYNHDACAEIHMISKDDWEEMIQIYNANPSDQRAVRYRKLKELEKPKKSKATPKGKFEFKPLRISELEKRYISESRTVEKIICSNWNDKKLRKSFTRDIQRFMSRRDPRHYLVEQIILNVPVPLLGDGIEFVDTPGLDDTDRYRVDLTTNYVKDVDVILYLTHSGRSYSQSDKDFIIEQLRRKTIKHLRLVVTKIDATFEQAKKDSRRRDDDMPSLSEHLELEKERLREQLDTTLNEMLDERDVSEEDKEYFLDQLGEIPIDFISSEYYWDEKESGIPSLREDLKQMLAKSERIIQAQKTLEGGLDSVLQRVTRTYKSRLEVINQEVDSDHVRTQLQNISDNLEKMLSIFERFLQEQLNIFAKGNEADWEIVNAQLVNILSKAEIVIIDEFEKNDIAKHWRTRRCGYWGSFFDIENKIASQIFPHVEITLKRYIIRFDNISNQIKSELERLQNTVEKIEQGSITEEDSKPINIVGVFDKQYRTLIDDIDTYVLSQRDSIIRCLDDFISDDVKDEIDTARDKVSSIWGHGTTLAQNDQVSNFYKFLRNTLKKELESHLNNNFKKFSDMLEKKTETIHPELKNELNLVIQDRLSAIELGLVELNEKQKKILVDYLTEYSEKFSNML